MIKILLIVALIELSYGSNQIPNRKIKVMASIAKPFVFQEKQLLKGMEIEMINNFASKMHLNVEYFIANGSLNEVFSRTDTLNQFMQSIAHLYVILNHIISNQSRVSFSYLFSEILTYSLAPSRKI